MTDCMSNYWLVTNLQEWEVVLSYEGAVGGIVLGLVIIFWIFFQILDRASPLKHSSHSKTVCERQCCVTS